MQTRLVVFLFSLHIEIYEAAERHALPALGQGRRSRPARKRLRRVKMLEIAAESPASGARFVRRRFDDSTLFLFIKQIVFILFSRNYLV